MADLSLWTQAQPGLCAPIGNTHAHAAFVMQWDDAQEDGCNLSIAFMCPTADGYPGDA